ncbi:AEX-3 domain-containing protein [Trichophaea hybrida]|nr:AEX-3 domain-containing protein [Trichophaea hybrida]
MSSARNLDPPLADYFWIAGIDSISYGEHLARGGAESTRKSFTDQLLVAIEAEEEAHGGSSLLVPTSTNGSSRRSNGSSDRLSGGSSGGILQPFHPSSESPQSVGLVRNSSNSSNSTITEANSGSNNNNGRPVTVRRDFDFDKALLKFAAERDSFLEDLSFSAGTVVPSKPLVHPRAQKVVTEEPKLEKQNSLRRRISLRDLTSMRRSPSAVNRASSIRTARRMSNYNSVIPVPQPLNTSPNMHPLKRKFEPVLLDRYPPKHLTEEAKRRGPFPDYVPMFAFPNDVNIVSADERPRSTWHGFTMTGGDNARLHGICVIIWLPLNPKAAEDLERRCEEWRRDNMTEEERELAASLGERLATERAKLSKLLARLPGVVNNHERREELDEEILATEEKIGLMADLLRPVRHGAAAKIEGLTDGETGLWIPRAYGILGKDASLTGFWKEWLKAIVVPMTGGAIHRIPASSPRVGIWQPLEKYVVNLCAEATSPVSSKTQVEVGVRELRLYARKEAANELPECRNTDLYSLFRALDIQNIVALFEYALSESRIILLSSHTSMLQLVSRALVSLMYPLNWLGIYIPVLPARLISALEAPCPYIVGIERRYEKLELPEDDFVCVDLDSNVMFKSDTEPNPLPKQQRRKLISLLQLAAPHHNRCGVPMGPPQYAVETFPYDSFMSEYPSVFAPNPPPSTLAKLVNLNSTAFGGAGGSDFAPRPPVFNAFLQAKVDNSSKYDRPGTSGTIRGGSPPSPHSPQSSVYPPPPIPAVPRSDSGFTLTATLRGKRSGNFDASSRRSSSFGFERTPTLRRPSVPFASHSPSPSTSSLGGSSGDGHSLSYSGSYAPSVFAPSTLAASTIMPNMLVQPVRNTDTLQWIEGHCMNFKPHDLETLCSVCEEKPEDGIFTCQNCRVAVHPRCAHQIVLPCAAAFYPDQIRAAFVRCFASLFYTYRKYLGPPSSDSKKAGKIYRFNMEDFLKSMPHENALYIQMLEQTQAFSEFIHDRESKKATDPSVKLFDEVILSKKNRGKTGFFSRSKPTYLADTSEHVWRTSSVVINHQLKNNGEQRVSSNRIPAKLDPILLRPSKPATTQAAPPSKGGKLKKKFTNVPQVQINGEFNGGRF